MRSDAGRRHVRVEYDYTVYDLLLKVSTTPVPEGIWKEYWEK